MLCLASQANKSYADHTGNQSTESQVLICAPAGAAALSASLTLAGSKLALGVIMCCDHTFALLWGHTEVLRQNCYQEEPVEILSEELE